MAVVVPFPRAQSSVHAVQIHARRDLRTGVVASGVVDARSADVTPVETLLTARMAWRDAGQRAPLAIAPPVESYADAASAGVFSETLTAAGFQPRAVDIEVDETALAAAPDLASLARLRARGFGIVLRTDATASLPLGQRERSLFTEIVMWAPARLDVFAAEGMSDGTPVARRLLAAREAGIPVTAVGAGDRAWLKALAAVGFDRSEDALPF